MKTFQHHLKTVEEYLHHRPPYLLVEKVRSCSPKEIVTEKLLSGDESCFIGHFPGAPIFPGALMQELTTQSAGILIAAEYNPMQKYDTSDPYFNEYALGVLVSVHHARYIKFARPGDLMVVRATLEEHLERVFDFIATISVNDQVIMRNTFRLANVESKLLHGEA